MFRLQVNGQDRVCGAQLDRNQYICYPYALFSGTVPATPVPNFQAPGVDLAAAFYTQLAIGGYWYDVIGWASGAYLSAPLTIQTDSQNRLYVNLPIGVYRFDIALTSGAVVRLP